MVDMVAAGVGLTLLPELATHLGPGAALEPLIALRPCAPPAPSRTIGLAWRRQFPREACPRALGELIQCHLPAGLRRLPPDPARAAQFFPLITLERPRV